MASSQKMTVAALYARVSTTDGRQSLENQIRVLRQYVADRSGLTVYRIYRDEASGAARERPALENLFEDAKQGKFEQVIVFALDRLTREGVLPAFDLIHRLSRLGISFASVTEPHFTTAGPAGELFIAIAAWMAKQEREHIKARVKAGLAEARRKGVTLGRPRQRVDPLQIQMLYVEGCSMREIARRTGLSKSTVERVSRSWRQKRNPANATRI